MNNQTATIVHIDGHLSCNRCSRPMRRRGVMAADAPGTSAWGHSGMCKSCVRSAASKPATVAVKKNETIDEWLSSFEEPTNDMYVPSPEEKMRRSGDNLNAYLNSRRMRLAMKADRLTNPLALAA